VTKYQGTKYRDYGRSTYLYESYITRADYPAAASKLVTLISQHNPAAVTLLDVGCGPGKHLECLQNYYQCEGMDLSDGFLKIARERCPGIPIHKGDMTGFKLGKQYDVISCLFVAIAYVRSPENLSKAISNMARHLRPSGVLFVEPWVYPENFRSDRLTADYVDAPDRKLARMYISKTEGRLSVYEIHYLVGTPDGIDYFVEQEELGLFTHEEYCGAFEKAGLTVSYDAKGGLFPDHNIGMYVGKRESP
jgi:SAM-dependent methyltransferase